MTDDEDYPRRSRSDMQLGHVLITAREIYDAVMILTGRVDKMISQQADGAEATKDHELRIRSLEKWRWSLPSAAILLAALSALVTILKP